MDALRQALADNEAELATTLARRRTLAVEREKLQLQLALCEKVCVCRETRLQIKQLIEQEEAAEAAAESAAHAAIETEMALEETVADSMPDTING